MASTVTEATITATPTDANADVSFDSQDSNDVTDGHQVALVAGRNAVTITVTAEDSSTQDYTISVNQSVAGDYGWRAQDDLDGLKAERISTPFGIWTNSTTIWVVSTDGEKAYAYNHDGTRDAAKDFDFDSSHQDARGAWSDGEYVWIADRENTQAVRLRGGHRHAAEQSGIRPEYRERGSDRRLVRRRHNLGGGQLRQLDSVGDGQPQVHQDQVGLLRLDEALDFIRAAGHDRGMARCRERVPNEPQHMRLVVHRENARPPSRRLS